MKKNIIALSLALAGVAASSVVFAEEAAPAAVSPLTGNLTLASEYLYRGIAQSNRKPAIQGGFDYAFANGFYVGNWNSSISWLSDSGAYDATSASYFNTLGPVTSSVEMDFYGGYKGTIVADVPFDVGILRYQYPGSYPTGFLSPNTTEIYGSVGYSFFTFKYSRSTGNLFGATDSKGSGYFDLTANYDLGNGIVINGHVGRQDVHGPLKDAASYTDYKIGATIDLSGYALAVAVIGTNAKGDSGEFYRNAFGKDLGKSRLFASIGKTF